MAKNTPTLHSRDSQPNRDSEPNIKAYRKTPALSVDSSWNEILAEVKRIQSRIIELEKEAQQ